MNVCVGNRPPIGTPGIVGRLVRWPSEAVGKSGLFDSDGLGRPSYGVPGSVSRQSLVIVIVLACLAAICPSGFAAGDLAAGDLAAGDLAAGDLDVEMAEQQAFRDAVARVEPAVVRIETVGGIQRLGKVLLGTGPTTGLIVDADGYIVSSAFNFLNRPASILVRLPDGSRKPAELIATDHARMIVLLKVNVDEPLPVAEIVPRAEMRVGQWAIAVGRTFQGEQPNMSVGILSATGRIWGKAIQTDAATSPSNYGGPLVDITGRVLGVIVPLSPKSAEEVAGFEWYDSGIGFAIDVEHIQSILPRLKKGEDLFAGVIGINMKGRNPSIGEPEIVACRPNSPASDAGLKTGDRIIEVEGRKILRAAGVKEELSRRYAGSSIHMVVMRDDKRLEFDVELAAKLEPYQHPMLGILPMRTPREEPGIVVRYVYPKSPAAGAKIAPGDLLVSFAGEPIEGRDELLARIAELKLETEVEIEVQTGDQTRKVTLKVGPQVEDLPPAELPPARDDRPPHDGELPEVGTVEMKIPEMKNDVWAYVPEGYDPAVAHGVVVWLHSAGGFEWDKLLPRWKTLCDRHDLILLAPKSADPKRWQPSERALVKKLLDEVSSTYTIDPTRVVAHGHQLGGAMAYMVAFGNRELVRAVAVVDAPVAGRPPENDPPHRLSIYMTTAKKSKSAAPIKAALPRLREMKIPVTVKDLGEDARYLNEEELAELVRWIDMLDRI